MRLTQTLRWALILGAFAAALGGCAERNSNVALIPAANSPISDVPVPAGFTIDQSKSLSHVAYSNAFRSVNHEYKGSDEAIPVVRFYKEQMPGKDWKLLDQNEVKGTYTLRFNKGKEDCAVAVWKGTLDTHISVTIGPSAATATK